MEHLFENTASNVPFSLLMMHVVSTNGSDFETIALDCKLGFHNMSRHYANINIYFKPINSPTIIMCSESEYLSIYHTRCHYAGQTSITT